MLGYCSFSGTILPLQLSTQALRKRLCFCPKPAQYVYKEVSPLPAPAADVYYHLVVTPLTREAAPYGFSGL